jgi:hypothetical protein
MHIVPDVVAKAVVSSALTKHPKATSLQCFTRLKLSIRLQHEHGPHRSHFCASTIKLTVIELTQMDLEDAFLAYLIARETAKGEQDHADEASCLAVSMAFAGFISIVVVGPVVDAKTVNYRA